MKEKRREDHQLKRFWINTEVLFEQNHQLIELTRSVRVHFLRLTKSKGLVYALKYYKEVERHCKMTFLEQESIFDQSLGWTRLDARGLPRFLHIDARLGKDVGYQRGALTVLGFYRLVHTKPDLSTQTIEQKSKTFSLSMVKSFGRFSRHLLNNILNVARCVVVDRTPIYGTAKAGISGPMAMGNTSIKDYKLLQKNNLLWTIRSMARIFYADSSELFEAMHFTNLEYARKSKIKSAGRIHFLSEGGGKTRAIAITDVFSQSVLWPIHSYIMDILRAFGQDGTFDHAKLAGKLTRMTRTKGLYCFDLTAATDRFPVVLQAEALKPLLGKTITRLWLNMVQRDFSTIKNGEEKILRYAVGQPMGFLSSWPVFALTHHLLVHFAAHRSGGKPSYLMIGDDVAISDLTTAKEYVRLCRHFDMPINMSKSVLSKPGLQVGEIAKRYAKGGVEMSPIPPAAVANATLDANGYLEFLEVLSSRTNQFSDRFSSLNLVHTLQTFLSINKDKEKIHTLYSCPIKRMVPFLEPLELTQCCLFPAVTGSSWTKGKVGLTAMLYDGFLRETAAKKVLQFQEKLKATERGRAPLTTPILEGYLYLKQRDLEDKVAHINFLADTATSRKADALIALEDMLSEPDVTKPSNFTTKRDIRRMNTVEGILKFKQKLDNPFGMMPPGFPGMPSQQHQATQNKPEQSGKPDPLAALNALILGRKPT